jgi:exopolyphosphatase / guanosine-5'-triphosphate,3'-diphosphate pyrophosphatase
MPTLLFAGKPALGYVGEDRFSNWPERRVNDEGETGGGAGEAPSASGTTPPPPLLRSGARPGAEAQRFGLPGSRDPRYAALDLGTNNCRLLIARPDGETFRVVDAFSRIVRLGEGIATTGNLSDGAMARTLDALAICRRKIEERNVARVRLVTTEACRVAGNGLAFLARVKAELGLELELLDRRSEAFLAAAGCAALAHRQAESVVLFDIGGGSTELVWLAMREKSHAPGIAGRVRAWASLPVGVVTLAERHGGLEVTHDTFETMVAETLAALADFTEAARHAPESAGFHLLGTSGTVTTLGGLHLGLEKYDRRQVDGLWMRRAEIDTAIENLLAMPYAARAANGCIGRDRADLVIAGAAIFEAIRRAFPCESMRIGDRGLREGMLIEMMRADGVLKRRRR